MISRNGDLISSLHDESDAPVPVWGSAAQGVESGPEVPARETVSAAEFTPEGMLRGQRHGSVRGWRRVLFVLTRGYFLPGPSAAEVCERELIARLKTPIRGCRKVAFVSRK